MRAVLFILVCAGTGVSQPLPPAIFQNGVTNAASLFPAALPGGVLAPGARFTIRGVRLASGAAKPVVQMRSGGTVKAVDVVSAAPGRVEAIVPGGIRPGTAEVIVVRDGVESRAAAIRVASSAPGLYSANGEGFGLARIAPKQVVRPGERVAIPVTGLGTGAAVRVSIGGVAASNVRAARKANGVEEIEFTVPRAVPAGCFVPVYAIADTGMVSNVVTLPVDPSRDRCRPQEEWITPAAKVGTVLLTRLWTLAELRPGDPQYAMEERVAASFLGTKQIETLPLQMFPPAGTCAGFAGTYEPGSGIMESLLQFGISAGARGLEAGRSLALEHAGVTHAVRRAGEGVYRGELRVGRERIAGKVAPPVLQPGLVRISSEGGGEVGPFETTLRVKEPLVWKNRESLDEVVRAKGVAVEWTGADSLRPVLVIAVSVDRLSTAGFAVVCAAAPGRTRFEAPGEMLANLPVTQPAEGQPMSFLLVVQSPEGGRSGFGARGLEAGTAVYLGGSARSVMYR